MTEPHPKRRIRFSSRGWFRYWTKIAFGYRDFRTGAELPDAQGRKGWGDIWIGPFASAEQAFQWRDK